MSSYQIRRSFPDLFSGASTISITSKPASKNIVRNQTQASLRSAPTLLLALACTGLVSGSLGCGSGALGTVGRVLTAAQGIKPLSMFKEDRIVDGTTALCKESLRSFAISQVSIPGQVLALAVGNQWPPSIGLGSQEKTQSNLASAVENDYSGHLPVLSGRVSPALLASLYEHGGHHDHLDISSTALTFGSVSTSSSESQTLTLIWTGAAPMTIDSGVISGAGFELAGAQFPITLRPETPLPLVVQFAPKTVGSAEGQLTIRSSLNGDDLTVISLKGKGVNSPVDAQLTVSASLLNFGDVTVGSSSTQVVTLTSTGTTPVTVSSATLSGTLFRISGGSLPITLSPMQSTSLQVEFTAIATGNSSARLTVNSTSARDGASTIALVGIGVVGPSPQLTASAGALSFGSVTVDSSTTQSLTLTSTGTAPLTISAAKISGANFTILGAALPVTMSPKTSVTLQIQFAPISVGQSIGQILISSNSSSAASTIVTLRGTSTAESNPQLTLNAMTLNFDSVPLGSSTIQAVTLTSTGTSPVTVDAVTIAGAGFSILGGDLPATLNPAQNVVIQVEFIPKALGGTTGQITITSNSSSGGTMTISLNGVGTAASTPQLTTIPSTLSFGSTTLGAPVTQLVTLTSTGTLAVTISAAVTNGTSFSILTGTLPATLAPNQSMSLQIQFDPVVVGLDAGALTLSTNSASGSSSVVPLIGTGVAIAQVVDLSWSAPTSSPDPVAGYSVYRSSSAGTFQLMNLSPQSQTSFVDLGVVSGTTYNYIVKSVDGEGAESDASNQIVVAVP